ncbi:MAG TPA: ATP-binding protein [Burkholderiaceae bacterium]|jgi:two-component system OmpR family sensor kinase|nr:ATP-binding protein [Burkholderiaceae bacterium]
MNRLFLRFFGLVMLSISLATVVIYFSISYFFGDPLEEIARKQASAQIFLLEQYIDKAPADEWLVRLNKVREVSNFDLELIPLPAAQEALSSDKGRALGRGEIVLDLPGKSFYRRVDLHGERYVGSDCEVIHAQGLPIDVGLAVKMEALRFVIVALALLIPIGFWSRAHWRGLQILSKAADDFGAGRLATRLTIARNASIYPLADCMNQMAQRIESLLDAHKNLLHSVSHELRTPIARLGFGLELLREEAQEHGQQGLSQARMQAMEEDLAELNTLVNELLNLTKLEQQQNLVRTNVDLLAMLQENLRAIAYGLVDKELSMDFADNLGELAGDRRLLSRAVGNLLLNAMKYGNRRVAVSAHKLADGTHHISVEDDGPGIAPDQRQRIFEPFHRLDSSRDRDTGGFGLGLAIANKAVQLHGGYIVVSDSVLGGAKFTLTLPAFAGETLG